MLKGANAKFVKEVFDIDGKSIDGYSLEFMFNGIPVKAKLKLGQTEKAIVNMMIAEYNKPTK